MPFFDQCLDTLRDYLNDHAVKLMSGLALMGLGWYFGRRRARADWKKQEFLDRLNLSLNTLEKGTLKIRTLSEKRCEEVFLNAVAADTVQKLAKQTTAADPILPLPAGEGWFYLNSVLNDLAEQFALGQLKRDMGGTVTSAIYVMTLTCETAGDLKTRKIRAMVIKKSLLTQLPAEVPQLESPHHITRWQTLQFLSAEFARDPSRFIEIELSVP